MIQAAVNGVVDFRQARPYDRQWMDRLRILLAEMLRQREFQLTEVLHRHYLGLLQIPTLTDESFGKFKENVEDLLDLMLKLDRPWGEDAKERHEKHEVKAATDAWESRYGELSDPKVQEAIEKTATALRGQIERHHQQKKAHQFLTPRQEELQKGRRRAKRNRISRR